MRLKTVPALIIAALVALVIPASADVCIGSSCSGDGGGGGGGGKPVISIFDAKDGGKATKQVVEGNICSFTIHRSGNLNQRSSVKYTAKDGSAVSPLDYSLPPHEGQLTAQFPPGKANVIVQVQTNDVQDDQGNSPGPAETSPETFSIHLIKPNNAVIGDGTATCSIIENNL